MKIHAKYTVVDTEGTDIFFWIVSVNYFPGRDGLRIFYAPKAVRPVSIYWKIPPTLREEISADVIWRKKYEKGERKKGGM